MDDLFVLQNFETVVSMNDAWSLMNDEWLNVNRDIFIRDDWRHDILIIIEQVIHRYIASK